MSDEVSDFLRSVELLKGRREEEDEARSRELEEKILQEKKERQARRAGTPIFFRLLPSLWSCRRIGAHASLHRVVALDQRALSRSSSRSTTRKALLNHATPLARAVLTQVY